MISISIQPHGFGIGDGLQYSSLPENWFNLTEEKLIVKGDLPWFFEHNPFVEYLPDADTENFHFPSREKRKRTHPYLTNAEAICDLLGIRPKLIRPRLYRFENYSVEKRE